MKQKDNKKKIITLAAYPSAFKKSRNTRLVTGFTEKVYNVVAHIPQGKVLTYRLVAYYCGKLSAVRAVGNALNKNHTISVPCHRVVRSNGEVGGFNGGTPRKIKLLTHEGVAVNNKSLDLNVYLWKPAQKIF